MLNSANSLREFQFILLIFLISFKLFQWENDYFAKPDLEEKWACGYHHADSSTLHKHHVSPTWCFCRGFHLDTLRGWSGDEGVPLSPLHLSQVLCIISRFACVQGACGGSESNGTSRRTGNTRSWLNVHLATLVQHWMNIESTSSVHWALQMK